MPTMHQEHIARKGILFIFFLLISLNITLGQNSSNDDIPPTLRMKDRKSIWDKLKIPSFHSDTAYTCSVLTFKVTEHGTIDTVFVNGACHQKVKDSLIKHIKSTSGYWIPRMVHGKPVESKLFILPYFFINDFNLDELSKKILYNYTSEYIYFIQLLYENQKGADDSRIPFKNGKQFIESETNYLLPYGFSKLMR